MLILRRIRHHVCRFSLTQPTLSLCKVNYLAIIYFSVLEPGSFRYLCCSSYINIMCQQSTHASCYLQFTFLITKIYLYICVEVSEYAEIWRLLVDKPVAPIRLTRSIKIIFLNREKHGQMLLWDVMHAKSAELVNRGKHTPGLRIHYFRCKGFNFRFRASQ